MTEKLGGLALLRSPFPDHQINKLPKPYKKDSPKGNCNECGGYHGLPALHLSYVGHAALTDRLLDCDMAWNWEPLAVTAEGLPLFDKSGGLWIKLTVCGVMRLGYGHADTKAYMDAGAREKEVLGDAIRNAGMRFGAALDLWHKGDLHIEEVELPEENKEPDAKKQTEKPALEYCTNDNFNSKKDDWRKLIEAGRSSAGLIKTIQTRYLFTDEQLATIRSWEPQREVA